MLSKFLIELCMFTQMGEIFGMYLFYGLWLWFVDAFVMLIWAIGVYCRCFI